MKTTNPNVKLRAISGPVGNQRGVTLVEMLVSIIIIAGVVAGLLISFHVIPATSSQGNALLVLQQEATLALEDMAKAVRESSLANLSITATQLTTSNGTFSTCSGILYQDPDNDGACTLDGDELILLGDYTCEGFGMRVQNLTFTDNFGITANTISINLQVEIYDLASGSSLDTMTFSTQAYPRMRS